MIQRNHPYSGLWISFESGEGAGKGTQKRLLAKYLEDRNFFVKLGREPGTTLFGEETRRILQDPFFPELNPRTEMLLYIATGIEFYEKEVKPVLEKGGIFIADRWRDSTRAYQGYGLGIDLKMIDNLTSFSCSGASPDLTFLLNIDARIGLSKISGYEFGDIKEDKIESRELEFHQRANEGYLALAKREPNRFRVIDYQEGKPEEMHTAIRIEVDEFIKKQSLESFLKRA